MRPHRPLSAPCAGWPRRECLGMFNSIRRRIEFLAAFSPLVRRLVVVAACIEGPGSPAEENCTAPADRGHASGACGISPPQKRQWGAIVTLRLPARRLRGGPSEAGLAAWRAGGARIAESPPPPQLVAFLVAGRTGLTRACFVPALRDWQASAAANGFAAVPAKPGEIGNPALRSDSAGSSPPPSTARRCPLRASRSFPWPAGALAAPARRPYFFRRRSAVGRSPTAQFSAPPGSAVPGSALLLPRVPAFASGGTPAGTACAHSGIAVQASLGFPFAPVLSALRTARLPHDPRNCACALLPWFSAGLEVADLPPSARVGLGKTGRTRPPTGYKLG